MILYLGIAALLVLGVSLRNWRSGLLLCIAVGFLQDPIRKLLPGQPVALVVAVAICFFACMLGLVGSGERLSIQRLLRWFPRLKPAAIVFIGVVLAQSLMTVLRTGNPVLAGIGLLSYLSPPLALLLAERYAADFAHLKRWLSWYLAGAMMAGGSVLLQYAGWRPSVFQSIGFEWVYGRTGAVRMLNGLMRTSEIAAWHAAAGACLLAAVAIGARTAKVRWIGAIASVALVGAVFLTGRRKMLAEIALFGILFAILVMQYRRGRSRAMQFAAVSAVIFLVVLQLGLFGEGMSAVYLERGATVFTDAGQRLEQMTVGMFRSILERNGLFGAGAGTGGQGSQYFGGGTALVGGAAEGGLGKVLAELGLPGLLSLIWLASELARAILRVARLARSTPAPQALPLFGLIAFLPANAAVFLTAHQVYGDPFVLIVLGLVTGSILAYPRIAYLQARASARALTLEPARRSVA